MTSSAVIFDLDDTLYPEREFVRSGLIAVAHWVSIELGLQKHTVQDSLIQLHELHDGKGVFDQWIDQHNFCPSLVAEMVNVYRTHSPEIELFTGIPDLLKTLRIHGLRIGIVTDGWLTSQKAKVHSLGVADLVDEIVYSDTWGREFWKPHPRPWETALLKLNVLAKDSMYVGDNPNKDFIGSRKLGMATLRLRTTNGVYAADDPLASDYFPDFEARNISEVDTLIRQHFLINGSYAT